MRDAENSERELEGRTYQRMEMNYCRRCGALVVTPSGKQAEVCAVCTEVLRWMRGGGKG